MTKEQAQALASLVAALRSDWDLPGVMAQLAKVRDGNPFNIAVATIRAAANVEAKTPGVIAVTSGDHWREKVGATIAPRPPKPAEACRICGRHTARCLCDQPTTRPPTKSEYVEAHVEALRRQLREAKETPTQAVPTPQIEQETP